MIKIASIAALAFFALIGQAHAATLNIDLDLMLNGGVITPGTGGTYTPNLPLFPASSADLTLQNNAHVFPGFGPFSSIPNIRTRPGGALSPQNDYLAVINNPGKSGIATFSLTGDNVFAFTWGTIDKYNDLEIKTTDGQYDISGAYILTLLGNSAVAGKTQKNVEFIDTNPLGTLISATFTTTQNSFEAANFYKGSDPSKTPLPSAAWLFGSTLLALAFFSRRFGKAKV
jgi:hypothetical protein